MSEPEAAAAAVREPARWYFDLISPFAYFQLQALPSFADRLDIELVPVLFAGMLKHHGQRGPAEIPGKRRHTYRYTTWLARQQGLRFRYPEKHPFNPLPALRLLVALGVTESAVRAAYDFIWGEGRYIGEPAEWVAFCRRLGVDDPQPLIEEPAVKQKLLANTEGAIAGGAFGVPTLVVRGEQFWGYESLPMLREFLDDPALFQTEEMRRVDQLPVGVSRPA